MIITQRLFRRAAFAGVLFIGVECVLFWLAGQQLGILPVMAFVTLKGFAGFALLVVHLRSALRGIALNPLRRGLSGLGSAGAGALGAFLIALPGFLTTLMGLALFSPTMRARAVRWMQREKRRSGRDEIITLDADEWRDLGARRKTPRRKAAARELSP